MNQGQRQVVQEEEQVPVYHADEGDERVNGDLVRHELPVKL